ncbi:Variant surface glycoprotein [Trypanosoma congolense IL3000]|uniref:Variant surface glycoprotein n=1 Tax=Trypanosoma congolense (strain IL3000) TaxID=1068625 RepID=F9WHM9_TRYCI|nr:Variant surface glycoprotein [Trypanosoma congolense IL3000]
MMGKKLKFVICVILMGMTVMGVPHSQTNYNEEAHTLLCSVLKAAVEKYEKVKNTGSALETAIEKTIFGGKNGPTQVPSDLQMPDDYKPHGNIESKGNNTRKNWCGICGNSNQKHYPGESASHDLVCLCAPGQNGHPISGGDGKKLCGQRKDDWVKDGSPGWYSMMWGETGHKMEHLNKTWDTIVTPCLRGRNDNDLNVSLERFKAILKHEGMYQYIGEQKSGYECGGAAGEGVCVRYHSQCADKPWLKELEEAIQKEKEDLEIQIKLDKAKKDLEAKPSKATPKSPQKQAEEPQKTPRVAKPRLTEEKNDPPIAEKLIANITAAQKEDGLLISKSQWFLLAVLFN